MPEQIEDPTLSSRLRARQEATAATKDEDLTVADRLTRKAIEARTIIDLGDENESITTEIRIPTFAELDRLHTARSQITVSNDLDEIGRLTREVCEIIGGLCTDPSIGPEFWLEGFYSASVIAVISEAANEANAERVAAARRFRAATGGARAPATARVSRKTPA